MTTRDYIEQAIRVTEAGIQLIRDGKYPWSRLDKLIDRTATEIRLRCHGKKTAVAWSGGLDSEAVLFVAKQCGISDCMLSHCGELEWPATEKWLSEYAPKNIEVVDHPDLNLDWLAANPRFLFPNDSKIASQWYRLYIHRGQDRYFKAHKLDILITGRRRQDLNYVGKGDQNIYTTTKGITRYSPIADWHVIDVFALAIRENMTWAPCYSMPRPFVNCTHPWPTRQWCGTTHNGWAEVYSIDPSVVEWAATKIQSAVDFLNAKQ